MAVNTSHKRMSIMSMGYDATVPYLWETDGTVDRDDRQHLLDCYMGIFFGRTLYRGIRGRRPQFKNRPWHGRLGENHGSRRTNPVLRHFPHHQNGAGS